VFRVRLAQGGKIPVHTHPDTRNSTVLSGTLYVGFGDTADETRVVAVPTGAVYVAPANVPHYLWARDGDVVYQEGGVGPTATVPVKP
jgi:quercetin dioxygenase-like cupin family protein